MKTLPTLALISMLLLTTACSSNRSRSGGVNEQLITDIKADGSKRFSYTLTLNNPQGMGRGMGRGMGGGMSGGRSGNQEKMAQHMQKMKQQARVKIKKKLQATLKKTGYCREGYIELDQMLDRGMAQIIGECHESATVEDRQHFQKNDSIPTHGCVVW